MTGVLAAALLLIPAGNAPAVAQGIPVDSARVRQLQLELELARVRTGATGLWRRLMPSVTLTAGIGLSNALFYDTETAFFFPRDSYRLTLSVPLHEALMTDQHDEALLRQRHLEREIEAAWRALTEQEATRLRKIRALGEELAVLSVELALLKEIARFHQMEFEEGEIAFDALTRARLQVLGMERMILDRKTQLDLLRRNYALYPVQP